MKIAITGEMGSGKSLVANYLKQKGYPVIIADEVVDDLYTIDQSLIDEMIEIFSEEILTLGSIDKKKLKQSYFLYPDKMQQANEIIHQKVYEYMENFDAMGQRVVFFEVPLLFETNKASIFDEVWFIHTSKKIRLERLQHFRKMGMDEINQRQQFHMKPILKKFMSDVIIDNDLSIHNLYQQIDQQIERMSHDTKKITHQN